MCFDLGRGVDMDTDYFNKVMELIQNYIMLLDKEYAVISELLKCVDSLTNLEMIRRMYIDKLEQIRQLQEENHCIIRMLEDTALALSLIHI